MSVNTLYPRLIWVQINLQAVQNSNITHNQAHINLWLLGIGCTLAIIQGNALYSCPKNNYTLKLQFPDKGIGLDLSGNQSLNTVNRHTWFIQQGPILLLAKADTIFNPPSYINITLTNQQDIIDYLANYYNSVGSATNSIGSLSHQGKTILNK